MNPIAIERIFWDASRIESNAEREAYLETACGDDAELRRRVEKLLLVRSKADGLFEQPLHTVLVPANPLDEATEFVEPLEFLTPTQKPDSLGRLGHFEVLEVVGQGGMGIVLRALDEKLQRVVAIKVMSSRFAASAMARKRFTREAHAAAAVCHDHVVTIHGVDEAEGLPYLVMQFVSGVSLQQRLDRSGPLEVTEIVRIGMQTAAGLAAAHGQGLIHRDVKPANILLENGVERVKLTDFGLARAVDDAGITRTGDVTGTPQYMSPEQAQGHAVDARTDLFSLGSVMYAMCTGRSPFRADTTLAAMRRVCDEPPRAIREVNSEIPDWLVELIDRLLQKNPDDRIQSAREVVELLGGYLAHLQTSGTVLPKYVIKPIPRRMSSTHATRYGWLVAGLLLAILGTTFGVTEATGFTNLYSTVVRVVTGQGVLIFEIDDPGISVSVDGEELTLRGGGLEKFTVRPGQHKVIASKDGKPVREELVTITRGGHRIVTLLRESLGGSVAEDMASEVPAWSDWPKDAPTPAISPFNADQAKAHQEAWASHLKVPLELTNTIDMKFRLIPPGQFTMGTPKDVLVELLLTSGEPGNEREITVQEGVPHPVRLTKPYYLGQFEVTYGQFRRFVEATGYEADSVKSKLGGWSKFQHKWTRRPEHVWSTPGEWKPVEDEAVCHITWRDARAFCEWLTAIEGRQYVLPTEAQWEFACRAGTTGVTYANTDETLADIAWTGELFREMEYLSHHPQVGGGKRPNAFGLCDMLGNVWEPCSDWFAAGPQQSALRIDPTGPKSGTTAVMRGGAWYRTGRAYARSSTRMYWAGATGKADAGLGFRVALIGELSAAVQANRAAVEQAKQNGEPVEATRPE